jgi:hypothetical protein
VKVEIPHEALRLMGHAATDVEIRVTTSATIFPVCVYEHGYDTLLEDLPSLSGAKAKVRLFLNIPHIRGNRVYTPDEIKSLPDGTIAYFIPGPKWRSFMPCCYVIKEGTCFLDLLDKDLTVLYDAECLNEGDEVWMCAPNKREQLKARGE